MMYGNGYSGGANIFPMLAMGCFALLFLVALVMIIMWAAMAMRRGSRHDHMGPGMMRHKMMGRGMMGPGMMGGSDQPIEILKARYAKGEITKEQFEQMKKDLE